MNDPQIMSATQSVYLKKIKNDRKSTWIFRILILLVFLAVWEFSARFHIIDSFIFSSPGLIAQTMWHMILDKTLFLHTGITLWETLVSFFSCDFFISRNRRPSLAVSKALRHFRTLSCGSKQPSEIRSCASFDRMAWKQHADYHRSRCLGGNLWCCYQPLHRLL